MSPGKEIRPLLTKPQTSSACFLNFIFNIQHKWFSATVKCVIQKITTTTFLLLTNQILYTDKRCYHQLCCVVLMFRKLCMNLTLD